MKVRADLFHTPAEPRRGQMPCNICGALHADAQHAIIERWHGIGDSVSPLPPTEAHAVVIMEQLKAMGEAVPDTAKGSDFHAALSETGLVIGDLRQGTRPAAAAWSAARAAISGMLPPPTAAQWAALPDDDDGDAPDDRERHDVADNGDARPLRPRELAARLVANAALTASLALVRTVEE